MGLKTFELPDLGEGLEEAELVEWHVGPGDRVVADQPLASLETDKAVVDVPAPWSGTVSRLLAEPGETVAVGAPLVEFETGAREDAGAVVGRLERGDVAEPPGEAPSPATRAGAGGAARPAAREAPASRSGAATPRAMPAARALARREGIALADVEPTGPDGTITRADVARALKGAAAPREGWERLGGARRAMARRMARAAGIVPATLHDEADVTPWMGAEADVLVRLIRAAAAGAAAEPGLNAWFDADGPTRRLHERVDLGIAVDTPEGLYVPVLRGADALGPEALRKGADRLIAAVRGRGLAREDTEGATLTLSSWGSLGGRHGVLVVMPPQVAILGAGRAFARVGWGEDGPERRMALPLSLSFDHRAVTGGEAARFLAAARADLERPD